VATIVLHRGAQSDLDALWESDPESAAIILALLQEAKANHEVIDTFSSQDFGFGGTKPYNVQRWAAQQDKGRNLWRLKIWELERVRARYRVVYAFNPRIQRYYVLGVFDRDFNYDESDQRTQRVLEVYDRLDIPEYR
jgi:hypothetical protein